MRRLPALLICTICTLGAASAYAVDQHGPAIAERQAAFKEIKESMKVVKDNLKSSDSAALAAAADTVLENANRVTELFPAGSYEGDTRAKKKIWEKQDDFRLRQETLVENAAALVEATRGDDPEALKDAFKQTSKDCKGCHMRYRQLL